MYHSKDIANRIKSLAKDRGVQVQEILLQVGVSKNAVFTMQRGSVPKADSLAKIADCLGCSVDYLLGRTDTVEVNINHTD